MESTSRRNFLKLSGVALASVPFLGLWRTGEAEAADAKVPPLAKPTDALPKSLQYCPDANKPKECPDRKAAARKDQFCSNCQLYQALAGVDVKKQGKCLIMPAYSVNAGGWCKSWVKKP